MTTVEAPPILRTAGGAPLPIRADHWFTTAGPVDERALTDVLGPALDVGCGPGRHAAALAERSIPVLGIDITDAALAHARARGVPVLERCVFDRVPAAGRWRSALLLDGNLGIGGDPANLLRRLREVLAPDGRALVEVAAPGAGMPATPVHFEIGGHSGPPFTWTVVDREQLDGVVASARWTVDRVWADSGRHFAWIRP